MTVNDKHIVCLGGGIGTVNLIKGLKEYTKKITVVVSMADEGGSSGRLRRMYNIFPPGDIVSGMSALLENPVLSKLLTYRFPGDRYSEDEVLAGHKLGNLIMVAMRDMTGNFPDAIDLFKKTFSIPGTFLPATIEPVFLTAKTSDGQTVEGEEAIDLGRYEGERVLEKVFLYPKNASASKDVIEAIKSADVILAGPGDLYTTILPVLIVPQIAKALSRSRKKKIFIVNIANKPFETKGYGISDYAGAITKHLGNFPFDDIVMNDNYEIPIPEEFNYTYVEYEHPENKEIYNLIKTDLVNEDFPLYHSSTKLAKAIIDLL